MPNPYFQFKQFTVFHDSCAMKVGTDGVLLGAWTESTDAKTVLDIGTGSGLIALMLAQRSLARITAIEIDTEAATQAKQNAENSKWKHRIDVQNISFQDFIASNQQKFDLLVCNPPFFQNSLKSGNFKKMTARHTDSLPFDTLVKGVTQISSENANFAAIVPFESENNFIKTVCANNFFLKRKLLVKSSPTKEMHRCLLEFSKKEPIQLETSELCIHKTDGKYSEEYIWLTKDFYLNF